MSSTLTIGSIDLTDATKYAWRQLPQKKNYSLRVRDWRGRNSSRLTYRKLTSITVEFEVACLGATMTAARSNEAAIEQMCDDAAEWSIERTNPDFVGVETLFQEAVGGETPRLFSVQSGVWEEHDQALWGMDAPLILGHLTLTLVPFYNGVTPYPARLVFRVPPIRLVLAGAVLTPSPVTFPLVIPAPVASTVITMHPSPVTLPFVVTAPVVDAGTPRVMTPSPVAMPFVVPAPVAEPGVTNVTIEPDPVTMPFSIPAPTVDAGAFDMASVSSKFEYWFKSNDLAGSNGDGLTSWDDSGTHNRDATTGGTPPTLNDSAHALRTVYFNNTGFSLPHVNLATAQIFIVAKVTDSFFQGTVLRTSTTGGDANYGYGFRESFGDRFPYFHVYDTSGSIVDRKEKSTNIGALPFGFNLYRIEMDASGGVTNVERDQVAETLAANSTGLSGAAGLNPDNHCKFYLGELVIGQGLTSTELDNVEQALMDKWSL